MALKDKIGEILDRLLEVAKTSREGAPYSQEFTQEILMLGPTLEVATVPLTWRTETEKFRNFRIVSEVAKKTLATAVILIADARCVEEETICAKLGIRPTSEIGVAEFQRQYVNIRRERFDGDAGNFPRDWYTELILVVAKGPTIPVMVRVAYYTVKGESIRWIDPPKKANYTEGYFNLLPDWWC